MNNQIIVSLLERYCEIHNTQKTGLLLLDLPTGFGKTYEVLRFIYENYDKIDKKIIFLTNLKKNLPHETLKKFFVKENKIAEYDKNVVFINANVDCVIENLLENEFLIPESIKNEKVFKILKTQIEFYNDLNKNKKGKSPQETQLCERIKKEILEDYEPAFRQFITGLFYQKAKTKEERIKLLTTNKDFKWVAKVYPATLSFEKKVFFLSMDKFLVKNSPIVESSYSFFDDNFLKNALIFIDEFDASKEVLLKNIIENQLKKRTDIIGLFEQIYSSFTSLTIPSVFYQNSETKNKQNQKKADKQEIDKNKNVSKSTNNKNIDGNIATVIENLKQEIKKINDEFNISYSVKTIGLNNKKNFLFHDYQYHTIVADEKSFIYLQQDEKQQTTNVHFVKKDAARADKPSIMSFLNVVRNFISYFKTAVKLIAENYQQIKTENAKPTDDAFSLDNAIKTFLTELKISQENQQYLIESIKTKQFEDKQKNNQKKNQQKNNQNNETPILKIPQNDRSFYNNGFRYYDFEDSEMHDTKSKIFITDFDTTPEKMLLNLASSNFIVGISATAKIKTVIGNYDLKYLKKNLKENFLALSAEENKQLKAIFEERNKDYVPIKVEFIDIENVQTSLTSFGFEKVVFNELLTEIEKNADEYIQKRYLRIVRAYQKFVENDNIQSFLCFLNMHPKYGNQGCDLKVLDMFFVAIIEKYQKNIDVKKSYVVLDSKDFDNKKAKILEDLRKGQKIFLITTYQTLGAGQNIQYSLDNFETLLAQNKIKQIFQREEDNAQNNTKHNTDNTAFEKDFDAIYLDKPTNLLVNADGELTELTDIDVNKRIFQAEMLSEANQIFRRQVIYEIRRTFKKAYYKDRNFDVFFPKETYKSLFETRDYKNFVSKQVIQAIGRINRTNFKNNEIYIFADKEIAPSIKYFHNDEDNLDTIYLKEFEALQEKAKLEIEKSANNNGNNEDNELKINIERVNLHCHEWINAKVKGKYWSDPNIMAWQKLREISLKYPTVSKHELDNLEELRNWEFIYLPMLTADYKAFIPRNQYYFGQKEDYKNIDVDFSENKSNHTEISAKAVYLPQLMQTEVIKVFFEEKNYATDFQKNDYMLAPQIFNGIYKGALGEEIGKFILENYVIPKQILQELPAPIFERFDFMLDKGIFIDFKFWNDENIQDRDEQIKKIFELKVKDIQKKGFEFQKVFIINILAQNKYEIIVSNDGKLIEVPYLIDKNTGKINENMILQLRKLLI